MTPDLHFFETPLDFRKWLIANHESETELVVGFYTVSSGKKSITWPESVDEALTVGWIDGVRRNIDKESYAIRFTPRKPGSIWSAVNIAKAEALIGNGLMQPAGAAAFNKRTDERSKVYAFESEKKELPPAFEKKFKGSKKAWTFFIAQAPWYQKTIIHWVVTAKQEATRISRLEKLIEACKNKERLR